MFFLMSGGAASGKTTIARSLQSQVENLICRDADMKPVTDGASRCHNLEQWIQEALVAQAEGNDFLLTSHSPLGELLMCPSAPELSSIVACVIDCGDQVRLARLRARGLDPRWMPNQHTFNWASWHRLHAFDPQWEPNAALHDNPFSENFRRWQNWKQGDPRWQVEVIDTTHMGVEETLQATQSWVARARLETPVLTAAARWWEI
jgi:hypothetical protein